MCGLGAVSSPHSHINVIIAKALAVALEPRGHHATGFAWSSPDGHPWYWKQQGRASKVAPKAPLPASTAIIVHTRFATNGSPNDEANNHPVVAPGLALVHNGVISNDDDLLGLVGAPRVGEVDSYAAAALLAYGPEALNADHPTDLLGFIEGRAAVAWLDGSDPHRVHLARCSTSPLVTGRIGTEIRVAASTVSALQAAARSVRLPLSDVKDRPEGTYLSMRAGKFSDRREFIPGRDRTSGPRRDQGSPIRRAAQAAVKAQARAEADALSALYTTSEPWTSDDDGYWAWQTDRASRRGALLYPKKDGAR